MPISTLVSPHDLRIHQCSLEALLRNAGIDPAQPYSFRALNAHGLRLYTQPPLEGEVRVDAS
jgi:hypothetical protein